MATMIGLKFEECPVVVRPMGYSKRLDWKTKEHYLVFQRQRYHQTVASFTLIDDGPHHFVVRKIVESYKHKYITMYQIFTDDSDAKFEYVSGLGTSMHEAWADFKMSWHYAAPYGNENYR